MEISIFFRILPDLSNQEASQSALHKPIVKQEAIGLLGQLTTKWKIEVTRQGLILNDQDEWEKDNGIGTSLQD